MASVPPDFGEQSAGDAGSESGWLGAGNASNVGETQDHVGATADLRPGDGVRAGKHGISLGPLPRDFGRYRIERPLGAGGMATVFLATDRQLGRSVAIKIPRLDGEDEDRTRKRFQREALAASSLSHENLCPTLDVGENDGYPYLAMAFIDGEPLGVYVERRKLPEREIAALIATAAEALAYAHANGVIHRDLKPDNILVEPDGRLVVVDFGLARRLAVQNDTLTETGAVIGTPAYMSPEQAAGAGRAVGPGTDIYSLGVILYELLAGQRPFSGSVADVIGQHIYVAPRPLSQVRRGVDPDLEAICLQALAKKPEDRHESMEAFAAALVRWGARRGELSELEDSSGRMRWSLVVFCFGGAVALLATAWWSFMPFLNDGIDVAINLVCVGPFVLAAALLLISGFVLLYKALRRRRSSADRSATRV